MIKETRAKLHEASYYYGEADSQVVAAQESFTEISKLFHVAQDLLSRLGLGALSMDSEVAVQKEHAAALAEHMKRVVQLLGGLTVDNAMPPNEAMQLLSPMAQATTNTELLERSLATVEESMSKCNVDVWGQETELIKSSGAQITQTVERLDGVKGHFQDMATMVDEKIAGL